MQASLTGFEIDRLANAAVHPGLEVDDAAFAERRDHLPGLRVERDQAITGRHVDHAVVTPAVGPVRHAAAGELTWRVRGTLAFTQAMRPDQLAGLRIERDNRPPRAARGVDDAFHHQRRAFELELGTRPQ